MNIIRLLLTISAIGILASSTAIAQQTNNISMEENVEKLQQTTLGAGCFWCVEAIFEEVKGVESVVAGYAGGEIEDPSYRQVASGATGHAEVTRITYDPSVVSFKQLLEVFWHTHNPTTKNRQGADVGPQYRSVIFYHNEEQKDIAQQSLKKTDSSDLWKDSIVTQVQPLTNYSKAENYHQNYYENNPNAGYCTVVIAPKLKKFRKEFSHMLKEKKEES
ncbi:peptide-methionine (S)-S-oxide reductase MsrA [Fodinibius halophilus]|uniref:Peptide methionine sulfoxide reductase MsrA n=1 Tax=Fodinibius halophilus TaxID=1736908 RepID=A0A6M1SYH8_9BACT|nr:peptide-methionine (S)-S-oxide reductase MsrA [Fodinibius halophilus]NGP88958.1 peptide-methionine (S)-S-oxide reductase MsrA [Fodinibius halophilus]